MPTIQTHLGRLFTANGGESILDAAARAGIHFPYSCRTGRCSTCKAKVISGTSTASVDETGLNSEDREKNWILTCVRNAESDMSLQIEDLGSVLVPRVLTLPCRIHSLERLSEDILKVSLRLPPTNQFNSLAGQHVQIIGPGGIRRSYSLASTIDNRLELHIRSVQNGQMSKYWFSDAKENDLLRLHGPHGTFFLRDIVGMDLVFMATGTGIAPIKAMLESLKAEVPARLPRSITVLWGARHEQDLYWDVAGAHPSVQFIPVLSRAMADWGGTRGYVQDVLVANSPDWSCVRVYACGSDAMIKSARILLHQNGLAEQHFHSDAFVSSD